MYVRDIQKKKWFVVQCKTCWLGDILSVHFLKKDIMFDEQCIHKMERWPYFREYV